jgi:murein L,D-transpeptidase YafK
MNSIVKCVVAQKIDSIIVDKSREKMTTYYQKKIVKIYNVGVGSSKDGHKQMQGDNRTPEGKYFITMRNNNSVFYKNLHISYPNDIDRANAKKANVNPGGDIKIHGYKDRFGSTLNRYKRFDFTYGCVAVTNADMDELYAWVIPNCVIVIIP